MFGHIAGKRRGWSWTQGAMLAALTPVSPLAQHYTKSPFISNQMFDNGTDFEIPAAWGGLGGRGGPSAGTMC